METDIQIRIEQMIKNEIKQLFGDSPTENQIWDYRDANFLGGNYDHIFEKLLPKQ